MGAMVRFLGIAKWFCFVLGGLMYWVTSDSFGETIGIALGVAATLVFWMIIRMEETRQMGRYIAGIMQQSIRDSVGANNMVEIKRIRSGIIARVYVLNGANKVTAVRKVVSQALSEAGIAKKVWVLQVAAMDGAAQLEETRDALNEQLFQELAALRENRKRQ